MQLNLKARLIGAVYIKERSNYCRSAELRV